MKHNVLAAGGNVKEITGEAGLRRAVEIQAVKMGIGRGVIANGKPQVMQAQKLLVTPNQVVVRCGAEYLSRLLREANYLLN